MAARLDAEIARVQTELTEIDLLIAHARTEAARHESRRAAAAEKLAAAASGSKDVADLAGQLSTLTRRAALMEAQADILEGKRKAVARLHEWATEHAAAVRALEPADAAEGSADATEGSADATGGGSGTGSRGRKAASEPAQVSRLVLSAQEDLRREIARAMHDGPAQSLTNIVLQAQIVERLVEKDPKAAEVEVRQLIEMVQHTLEATKTFIFDVRPMVLDDLGLVPTLRRAARERGRRSGVAVEFETIGVDRRLPVDLESGLFRAVDGALTAYLGAAPEAVSLRLDWSETLDVVLAAKRRAHDVAAPDLPSAGGNLPPALAAMVEDRRSDHDAAVEAARRASVVALPAPAWRDLSERCAALGIRAELLDEGSRVHLVVDLPSATEPAAGP